MKFSLNNIFSYISYTFGIVFIETKTRVKNKLEDEYENFSR